jgi:hypothetical protein
LEWRPGKQSDLRRIPGAASKRSAVPTIICKTTQVLAAAPDSSVVISSIGFTTNLEPLLQSKGDQYRCIYLFYIGCDSFGKSPLECTSKSHVPAPPAFFCQSNVGRGTCASQGQASVMDGREVPQLRFVPSLCCCRCEEQASWCQAPGTAFQPRIPNLQFSPLVPSSAPPSQHVL